MGKEYIEKSLKRYNFRRPSFFEGMARILDFSGSIRYYQPRGSGSKTDYQAIKSDWEMIGRDMQQVINDYDRNIKPKPQS